MLLSIRKRPPGDPMPDRAGSDRPADMLLACHGRIRSFARVAGALASAAASVPPSEIAEAAAGLERYHRLALPLHEADEDHSLRPRLEAAPTSDALKSALERVHAEHRQIDALLAELLLHWSALAQEPTRLVDLAPRLEAPTAALAALWEPHLLREEGLIFPAAAELPAETQRLIADEMRARRGWGG